MARRHLLGSKWKFMMIFVNGIIRKVSIFLVLLSGIIIKKMRAASCKQIDLQVTKICGKILEVKLCKFFPVHTNWRECLKI